MKQTLPPSISPSEYLDLRKNHERWRPRIAEIAATHAFGKYRLTQVEAGSNLLALLGDELVIKVFPPFARHEFESEQQTLRRLSGCLSIPVPEVVVAGEIEWPYIVMTQLPGIPLSGIWNGCAEAEKCRILEAVGRLIAEVPSIDPGPLTSLDPSWSRFVADQTERCTVRHRRLRLPEHLVEQIAISQENQHCAAEEVSTSNPHRRVHTRESADEPARPFVGDFRSDRFRGCNDWIQ
jgi:hygromycin-B 7''-O-kinase